VSKPKATFSEDQQLYRPLTVEQDREQTNTHYEQPVEFFYTLTGGEWNVYSANLWTGSSSQTESQERKLDILAEMMDLQPGMRILDVGCGSGELLHEMVVRVPYGEEFVGVDPDPTAVAAARSIADPRMKFLVAGPESLPFDDASFDLVVAAGGVLRWPDPAAGLAELARVVSDTGRVVLAERARAGRTVRELLGRAGLTFEREETVVRAALPLVRAFIASP